MRQSLRRRALRKVVRRSMGAALLAQLLLGGLRQVDRDRGAAVDRDDRAVHHCRFVRGDEADHVGNLLGRRRAGHHRELHGRVLLGRDALDRGGVSAKSSVAVEVGPPKPYEQILEGLDSVEAGSREDFRRSQELKDNAVERAALSPAAQQDFSVPIEADVFARFLEDGLDTAKARGNRVAGAGASTSR